MLCFSLSSNLISTSLNHLLRFLNYRCTNSGLIIKKHSILGILGSPVPAHPGPVPVQVAFCWPVPVQVGPVQVQVGLWWPIPVHSQKFFPDLLFLPLLIPINFIQLL